MKRARIDMNVAVPKEAPSVKRYPVTALRLETHAVRRRDHGATPETALPAESEMSNFATPVSISVTLFSKPET
jgi:hypothetical protein